MLFMIAIMTVTGADRTGIIAQVTTALAELNVNIVDVSQTLMSGYFTMILRVEILDSEVSIQKIQDHMKPVEEKTQQVIRIQSEDLFTAMNEI
ncbi:ACT domain protein [Corynebacterium ammoniagenes DSM 20306]|nr:ACT domain protein [Corynebacterium ammoniagenes DSM 20306]